MNLLYDVSTLESTPILALEEVRKHRFLIVLVIIYFLHIIWCLFDGAENTKLSSCYLSSNSKLESKEIRLYKVRKKVLTVVTVTPSLHGNTPCFNMSSEATNMPAPRPMTPTSPSSPPRSPVSPMSPGSLRLPASHNRERSPSPMRGYLLPSPLPTRRNRTFSASARAAEGPSFTGVCKCFSRSRGHGFITPSDGGNDIFVHISDIEGEYVPVEGDEVSYKICSLPPKCDKVQAVEVTIIHLKPGSKHETWGGSVVSA